MSLYGKGMLITFSETPPEVEEDFNEWYNREHVLSLIHISEPTRPY